MFDLARTKSATLVKPKSLVSDQLSSFWPVFSIACPAKSRAAPNEPL